MDTKNADKIYKRRVTAICDEQILLSRESSKLCFGQPEMLRASQNTTCSGLQPEAASSKVGSPDGQIINC